MKTNANHGEGVVSYDIFDITPAEMDTMLEMRETIRENLANHKDAKKPKKYLDDNQLKTMFSILYRLTKGWGSRVNNSFKTVDVDSLL